MVKGLLMGATRLSCSGVLMSTGKLFGSLNKSIKFPFCDNYHSMHVNTSLRLYQELLIRMCSRIFKITNN